MNSREAQHHIPRSSPRLRLATSASQLRLTDSIVLFLDTNLAASLPPAFAPKPVLQRMISALRESGEFRGKKLEIALLHTWGQTPWKRIILVGLGPSKDVTRPLLSRAAAAACRRAGKAGCQRLGVWLSPKSASAMPVTAQCHAVTEGLLIGAYEFDQFKASSQDNGSKQVNEIVLFAGDSDSKPSRQAVGEGQALADAVNYARQIANLPGNLIYPQKLAEEAIRLGRKYGLRVKIWDRPRLEKERFGGILAVGAGSDREPRFIQIEYRPTTKTSAKPVALVGKAITFDSGGISIKPSDKMDEMKFDKCGGVAVLGAMRAIAALKLPIPVVGLIAAAENMPSATSYRPGDIVTTYSGTTIEVLNTDAEGRIVLGDALAYAKRFNPQAILDFATLTGACVVALGPFAAGLFTNHDQLAERVRAAGEMTGDRVWPLPLWEEYHEMIKSPVADIKNTGGRYGGAITAAAFLQKFVGDVPWAHLDIAGTAWTTDDKPYLPRGGTAFGVRLVVEMLRKWKPM